MDDERQVTLDFKEAPGDGDAAAELARLREIVRQFSEDHDAFGLRIDVRLTYAPTLGVQTTITHTMGAEYEAKLAAALAPIMADALGASLSQSVEKAAKLEVSSG